MLAEAGRDILMTLYPHEIVLRDVGRYIIKSGALKTSLIALGWGMLIFATASTTILLMALPHEPEVFNGVIAGMIMTGFLGLGMHLICFEPKRRDE